MRGLGWCGGLQGMQGRSIFMDGARARASMNPTRTRVARRLGSESVGRHGEPRGVALAFATPSQRSSPSSIPDSQYTERTRCSRLSRASPPSPGTLWLLEKAAVTVAVPVVEGGDDLPGRCSHGDLGEVVGAHAHYGRVVILFFSAQLNF